MNFNVSVIIPTFNRIEYLGEALESALRQTRPPEEIIVVDDGSTDGTREMMESRFPSVRYIQQGNAGPAAARNRGMREAGCDWIAFLDSDDLWPPEKLESQSEFIARKPGIEFTFGTQVNMKDGVRETDPEILNWRVYRQLRAGGGAVQDFFLLLLACNPVPTSSVLFRKSCLDRVGFLDETRVRSEDYDFWFRFASHCRVGFQDAILAIKRSHESNLINDYMKLWTAHLSVLRDLPGKNATLHLRSNRAWRRAVAETVYRLGSFELSRGKSRESARWFADLDCLDLAPLTGAQLLAAVKKTLVSCGLGAMAQSRECLE